MFTEKDIEIIKQGLREATQTVLFAGRNTLEERVFPVWRKTVHNILVAHGCPCSKGENGECFLTLPDSRQRETFASDDILALGSFIGVIEQGLLTSTPTVAG
jgi:hypothetical protein